MSGQLPVTDKTMNSALYQKNPEEECPAISSCHKTHFGYAAGRWTARLYIHYFSKHPFLTPYINFKHFIFKYRVGSFFLDDSVPYSFCSKLKHSARVIKNYFQQQEEQGGQSMCLTPLFQQPACQEPHKSVGRGIQNWWGCFFVLVFTAVVEE